MAQQVKDLALSFITVAHLAAVVQVQSLAWKLPHADGAAQKKRAVQIKANILFICQMDKRIDREHSVLIML